MKLTHISLTNIFINQFRPSVLFMRHGQTVQTVTVNIDLSDVTNRYITVLYRTVMVYEKKNRSLVFSGSRKIPTLGSTVQWETRQASFPTGTVGPPVGIFLSPLNTNDEFYLSYPLHAILPRTSSNVIM